MLQQIISRKCLKERESTYWSQMQSNANHMNEIKYSKAIDGNTEPSTYFIAELSEYFWLCFCPYTQDLPASYLLVKFISYGSSCDFNMLLK